MPQPLAPKPLDPTEQAGQLSQVGKPRKPTPSARVSAACEACKKRRSRCTGRPPCQRCQNLGTECVFDLSLDMRRRAALQRTINESRLHQETLNGLIEGIRSGPSDHLDSLFQFIRSDASRDEVMNAIRRFWKDIENQGLDHMMLVQEGLVEWPTNKPQQSRAGLPGNLTGPQGHDAHHPSSIWLASSELQNRRQVLDTSTISSLLSTLKPTSLSGGEELLGRSVEFETLERYASPPWSATSSSSRSEGSTSVAEQTGGVERSDWHPALQMRSPTNRAPEQPQVVSSIRHSQRQAFEVRPPKIRPGQSPSRAQTSTRATPTRTNLAQPHINADSATSSTLQASPSTALYSESVSCRTPTTLVPNNWDLSVAQEDSPMQLRIPQHLVLPLTIPDASYLSRIYTHYLQGAKQMLRSGVPRAHVLGADDEVAVDLFFRSRTDSDKFDCASWACEVFRSYDTDIFARMGSSYMLTLMMRWLLVPTPENYQKIPEMMKPTPYQCMVPHIPAIETIPMAPVRDAVIHRLRDWLTPLITCNWSVNWKRGMDAAVQRSPSTGATILSPEFREHVTDYDNWSVGKRFLKHFPEVAGRIRIHG